MVKRPLYRYGDNYKVLNYGGRPLIHKRGAPVFYGNRRFNTWEKFRWLKIKK